MFAAQPRSVVCFRWLSSARYALACIPRVSVPACRRPQTSYSTSRYAGLAIAFINSLISPDALLLKEGKKVVMTVRIDPKVQHQGVVFRLFRSRYPQTGSRIKAQISGNQNRPITVFKVSKDSPARKQGTARSSNSSTLTSWRRNQG